MSARRSGREKKMNEGCSKWKEWYRRQEKRPIKCVSVKEVVNEQVEDIERHKGKENNHINQKAEGCRRE